MRKRLFLLILLLALPSFLLGSALLHQEEEEAEAEMTSYLEDHLYFDTLRFRPHGNSQLEEIQGFHDWTDGIVYVFLPSYAEGRALDIGYAYADSLRIDETVYDGDAHLDAVSHGEQHIFTLLDENGEELESYPVMFLCSRNLPALFLSTESGTLTQIHADRDYTEAGYLTIFEADGQESYSGVLAEVSGRGNTTWQQAKKPYSIKLDSADGLLGMEHAKRYELLANFYDGSHLRNEAALTLARTAGLEATPDSAYADLYINGEYKGLYQLMEKVEIAPGRLDIPKQEVSDTDVGGSYLFMMEDYSRYEAADCKFLTDGGQPFVLKSPDEASEAQVSYITELVNRFEQDLLSTDSTDYLDDIDLDSFMKKYLVEEITKNSDAVTNSQYFYKKAGEDTLYAGPVWDYDNSLGHTDEEAKDPRGLLLSESRSYSSEEIKWYAALWNRSEFRQRTETLYAEVFSPALQQLTDSLIPALQEQLSASALMDWLRWDQEDMSFRYAVFDDYYSYVNYLKDFITQRKDFLDRLWIDHETFYTVTFRRGEIFSNLRFTVEPNEAAPQAPEPYWEGRELEGWYYDGTDIPYEPGVPVTEDVVVTARWTESS